MWLIFIHLPLSDVEAEISSRQLWNLNMNASFGGSCGNLLESQP